uniref:hypothetical protein n=1 Tax=Sulfitobacter sp. TaxID=1903071 RepID=UPI00272C054E
KVRWRHLATRGNDNNRSKQYSIVPLVLQTNKQNENITINIDGKLSPDSEIVIMASYTSGNVILNLTRLIRTFISGLVTVVFYDYVCCINSCDALVY